MGVNHEDIDLQNEIKTSAIGDKKTGKKINHYHYNNVLLVEVEMDTLTNAYEVRTPRRITDGSPVKDQEGKISVS